MHPRAEDAFHAGDMIKIGMKVVALRRAVGKGVDGHAEHKGVKTVTAIITNDSVQDMELKIGDKASALIKASHIILAVSN